MNEKKNSFLFNMSTKPGEVFSLIEHLFDVAKPEAVYSDPTEVGDYVVITVSELLVSMGAGYGSGSANPSGKNVGDDLDEDRHNISTRGGGGGGGFSLGRPVAAISIGPKGMHVEPIVDPTKISIAFFTTLAAIAMTIVRTKCIRRN